MSDYGDYYRQDRQNAIIRAWCPEWVRRETTNRDIWYWIARGRKAEDDLKDIRRALAVLKSAASY